VKGDPQFGIIHRGRLYLFAGQQQLDIFKKYPERLAPVISGYDPVVFTDQRKLVDGIRELGVSYKGKVYLFNSKQSLQQFWTAPDRYANQATAAMQRTR
jgi:YHS domain-containing protein